MRVRKRRTHPTCAQTHGPQPTQPSATAPAPAHLRKGNTYWDIMLAPIFDAVKAVYTKPGKTIVFAPQGEMGGTVFYAPASYQKILDRVRSEYKGPAKLKTALEFNHAYVPGVINRAPDDVAVRAQPPSALDAYQGWGAVLPFEKWPEYARLKAAQPALLGLLDSVDVLGVSCYPRTGETPKPEEFEECLSKLDAELSAAGFNMKAWAARPGKALILSELGLGGGVNRCGTTPASSAKDAGLYAHLDVGYPWSQDRDPWSKPALRVGRRAAPWGSGCGRSRSTPERAWRRRSRGTTAPQPGPLTNACPQTHPPHPPSNTAATGTPPRWRCLRAAASTTRCPAPTCGPSCPWCGAMGLGWGRPDGDLGAACSLLGRGGQPAGVQPSRNRSQLLTHSPPSRPCQTGPPGHPPRHHLWGRNVRRPRYCRRHQEAQRKPAAPQPQSPVSAAWGLPTIIRAPTRRAIAPAASRCRAISASLPCFER
jgi:hypothetical protein